jgi:hypothetical protein
MPTRESATHHRLLAELWQQTPAARQAHASALPEKKFVHGSGKKSL